MCAYVPFLVCVFFSWCVWMCPLVWTVIFRFFFKAQKGFYTIWCKNGANLRVFQGFATLPAKNGRRQFLNCGYFYMFYAFVYVHVCVCACGSTRLP